MTDLNREAAELGEYGSDPNDNGAPADSPAAGSAIDAGGADTDPDAELPLRAG